MWQNAVSCRGSESMLPQCCGNKIKKERTRLMIGTSICFDLGTGYLSVFVQGKGIIANEPSVVAYDVENEKISVLGKKAYEMIGKTPDWIDIINPIKDGGIADYQIVQNIIGYYVQKVCQNKILKPNVLISIPCDMNSVDKRSVLEMATASGASRACLIEEPLAAAIGAGVDVNSYHGTMIVDIGAGTTDIAVIARGMVCSSKSVKVAGNLFNDAIISLARKEKNLIIGYQTAEIVKKDIGCTNFLEAELALRVVGKDASTNLPVSTEITSADVFLSLNDHLEMIVESIRQVLEKTPPELTADVSKTGITITGGSALLTGIERYIEYRTGITTRVAKDPQTCVIRGMGRILKAPRLLERNGYYFKTRQELVGYEE